MDMLTRRPPGRVRVRVVPRIASKSLMASVARISILLRVRPVSWLAMAGASVYCNAVRKDWEKAEMEGKRSSGFFARACRMTVSTSGGRPGLNVLGLCVLVDHLHQSTLEWWATCQEFVGHDGEGILITGSYSVAF